MHTSLSWRRRAIVCLASITLVSCGGGGSSYSSSGGGGGGGGGGGSGVAITGTAATGGPITGGSGSGSMNGVVTLKDSSNPAKTVTTSTDSNGVYSFTTAQIQGFTAPFMLQINYKVGGVNYSLASAATAADLTSGAATINITPLTDLVIANLAHQISSQVFANANYSTLLTPSALSSGVAALDAELLPVLQQQGISGSVDLLHQSFSANGTGLDAVLDSVHVTIDASTGTETLTNTTTGATVSGTLSSPPSTPLPVGATNNLTDQQAISLMLTNLGAKLDSGASATDPTLLAFFDQTSFLQDGQNLSSFLQQLTTDTSVAGAASITFSTVELAPVPTWVTAVPVSASASYMVRFLPVINGAPNDSPVVFIVYKNTQGMWVVLGNQRVAKVQLSAFEGQDASTSAMCSGFLVNVNDKGGTGFTYAVVTGPGMPSGGMLLFNGGNGQSMQIAAGGPATFNGTATASLSQQIQGNPSSNSCAMQFSYNQYPMTDTQIAALTVPAQYTVQLFNNTSYASSNTPVATYTETLGTLPLTSTQETAAMFPSLVLFNPAGNTVLTQGGQLTANWTAPSTSGEYASSLILFACWNVTSGSNTTYQCNNIDESLSASQASETVTVPKAPSQVVSAGYNLEYYDASFRQYWTTQGSGSSSPNGSGSGGSFSIGGTASFTNVHGNCVAISLSLNNMLTGENLQVGAGCSTPDTFQFTTLAQAGATYAVTIPANQPMAQYCSVSNGSGTASGNVSNVAVTCN